MKARRFSLSILSIVTSVVCGCAAPDNSDASLDSGVQIISTSLDLSSVDLCWNTPSGQTLVHLDEQMLDSESTRLLDLPIEDGLHVTLVAQGDSCTAAPLADVALRPASSDGDSPLALVLSGSVGESVSGALVPVQSDADDVVSLRSSCQPGALFVMRTTRHSNNGGCWTRATLTECLPALTPGGSSDQGSYALFETYDSGWVSCSQQAVCGIEG